MMHLKAMSAVQRRIARCKGIYGKWTFIDSPSLSHLDPMRRITTISVLLLLLSYSGAPFVAAVTQESGAELPACCRRGGKHHCAMMLDVHLRAHSSGAPAFSAPPTHCPFYPQGLPQSWVPFSAAILPGNGAAYASPRSHPACHAQTDAHFRVSFDRSRQKRGPPSSLFS
jgi:hypothetical protein